MNVSGLVSCSPGVNSLSKAIHARCTRRVRRWRGPALLMLALSLAACSGGSGSGGTTATCFHSSTTTGDCLIKEFTDDPVEQNNTVTLRFTLSHDPNAIADATAITFSDDLTSVLPGLVAIGLPNFDVCGSGSEISGTDNLVFTGGRLAPGETCSFSVTLQVPPGASAGRHTNTTSNVAATVAGVPATANPATDDLEILGLSFVKTFTDDPVLSGDPATLEFTISNTNPSSAATSISFSDDLNAALPGLAAVGLPKSNVCGAGSQITGTNNLIFSGGTLAAGASCIFSVTLQTPVGVSAGTIATNTTSSLTGQIDGAGVSSDPASDNLQFVSPPGFSKRFIPDTISAGDISTVTFTIDNTSTPKAASALDFTDNFPAGTVFASPPNVSTTCIGGAVTATVGTATLSYTGGTVAANASCTVTVHVTSGVAGTYVNTSGNLTSSFGNSGSASDTLRVLGP
jgi:hypothetical protein